MDAKAYYTLLENKFPTYKELSSVAVIDNGEPMEKIDPKSCVRVFSIDKRMDIYTGTDIYVRQSLIPMLRTAQNNLSNIMRGCELEIVYGYRHPAIQLALFEDVKKELTSKKKFSNEAELMESVHRFVAVPEVAGHPAGAAVDIRIVNSKGERMDMGTEALDFVEDSYVHSPFIGKKAWHNRQVLRQSMLSAGFAPFDGEWWHFSFGDREWAMYYRRPNAIYCQIEFSVLPP